MNKTTMYGVYKKKTKVYLGLRGGSKKLVVGGYFLSQAFFSRSEAEGYRSTLDPKYQAKVEVLYV